jgi:hypothetical protein
MHSENHAIQAGDLIDHNWLFSMGLPIRGTFEGELEEMWVITPVPIMIIHVTDLNILPPGNRSYTEEFRRQGCGAM